MIIGKMDPEQFAKFQAEHRAKMTAATAKRDEAEQAALAARLTEAARLAGSYQPFARAFTGLREEFRRSVSAGIRRRWQNGRWVSYEVQAAELARAQKLEALGFGQ